MKQPSCFQVKNSKRLKITHMCVQVETMYTIIYDPNWKRDLRHSIIYVVKCSFDTTFDDISPHILPRVVY